MTRKKDCGTCPQPRSLFRILLFILSALFVMLAAAACGIGILLFTETGFRTTLAVAGRFLPMLQIGSVTGTLPDFTVRGVSVTLPGIEIESKKLRVAFGGISPAEKSIDVAMLEGTGLRISVDTSALSEEPQESASSSSFEGLPFAITLQKAQLANFELSVDGTRVALDSLASTASAAGKRITIESLKLGEIAVSSSTAETTTALCAQNPAASDFSGQLRKLDALLSEPLLKELPTIDIGLEARVNALSISALSLNSTPIVQDLKLAGDIQNDTLNLSQLTLKAQGISAALRGSARLGGAWPVDLLAEIKAPLEPQIESLTEPSIEPSEAPHVVIQSKSQPDALLSLLSRHPAAAQLSIKGELLDRLEIALKAHAQPSQSTLNSDAKAAQPSAHIDLTGSVELSKAGLPFALTLESTVDLADFSDIISTDPLKGMRIKALSLSGKGSWLSHRFNASASLTAKNLSDPVEAALVLEGEKARVNTAQLSLNHGGARIAATAAGRADAAGPLSLSAAGTLKITGVDLAKLSEEISRITSAAAAPAQSVRGTFDMQTDWTASAAGDLSTWKVGLSNLAGAGTINNYPIEAKGALDIDSAGRINAKSVTISAAGNTIAADVAMTDASLSGTVKLDARHLNRLLPTLSGTVSADAKLSGTLEHPNAVVAASAQGLTFEETKIDRAALSARIVDGLKKTSTLTLDLKSAATSSVKIGASRASFVGTLEKHTIKLSGSARKDTLEGALDLALTGGLDEALSRWKGALSSASVQLPIGKLRLQNRAALTAEITTPRIVIDPHCWTFAASNGVRSQNAGVCVNTPLTAAEKGSADITLRNFPLGSTALLLPKNFVPHGTITAAAKARWEAPDLKSAHAEITLSGREAGFVTEQPSGKADVTLKKLEARLALAPEKISADLNAALTQDKASRLEAAVTINEPLAGQRLSGTVRTQGFDLALLNPFIEALSPTPISLAGTLKADLAPAGTLKVPELQGTVSVQKLLVRGQVVPFAMRESSLALAFEGRRSTLTARVATGQGEMHLSGAADWSNPSALQAEISAQGKDLELAFAPYVTARVTPDVYVKAAGRTLDLSGTIDIPWARIDVETLPADAVAISKDEVIVDREDALHEAEPATTPTAESLQVHSTLRIRIGDDVRLSAFGLKTKLGGTLLVDQDEHQLGLSGQLKLASGSFRAYGQNLLIEKGEVTFSGPVDDPLVNIEAIRNPDSIADDVTAGVRVTGRVSALKTELFSDPAMDQSSILSYVLRGQGPQATTDDNALLTSALINVGLGQTTALVSGIGEMLRIRDLGISTAGVGNDSQVVVSGYVLPGLQVKYAVNIFDSLATLTLRYRLLPRLYLEASSGLTQTVDFLYNFEF